MYQLTKRVKMTLFLLPGMSVRSLDGNTCWVVSRSPYAPAREVARDKATRLLSAAGFKCAPISASNIRAELLGDAADFCIEVTE